MIVATLFGWHVQPLDVAALASLAAVAAPFSAFLVAIVQRRGERLSRTYLDRKAAYTDILRDAYNGRLHLEMLLVILNSPGQRNVHAEKTIAELEYTYAEEYARVALNALLAPESVMKAHRAYIEVWNRIDAEVDIDTIPPDPNADHAAAAKRVEKGLNELDKPLDRLRKAMRRDVTK